MSEKEKKIAKMWNDGLSAQVIAERLGLSTNEVVSIAVQLGMIEI